LIEFERVVAEIAYLRDLPPCIRIEITAAEGRATFVIV
jgi:hypothetical protein